MCCLLPEYVLSFARINVMYLPELGGQLPSLTPRPVRLWVDSHTSNDNSQKVGLADKGDGMMMLDRDTGPALPAASRHE